MFIPIILGTAREGRQSEKVANFLLDQVKGHGFETEILDVKDYTPRFTGGSEELSTKLSEKISSADGLIIVSPEYNHGYPGELKLMLDMIYDEYNRKPVVVCGVSGGGLGGSRAVEQLKLVAIELRMVPLRDSLYFSNVYDLFDESGNIKDQSYIQRTEKVLAELDWYVKALKYSR